VSAAFRPDALAAVKSWLDEDHEGHVMTLVEDGSFVEWIQMVVTRFESYEEILVELRGGYDDFYESGNNARLLNVEAKLRGLMPPLRDA
jgi:hypothetical protein